jgi:hypothetical protein
VWVTKINVIKNQALGFSEKLAQLAVQNDSLELLVAVQNEIHAPLIPAQISL